MLGGRPHDELMAEYRMDHRNRLNKLMHLFGIPAVVAAVALWVAAPFVEGAWKPALVLTPIGIALQLIGHRIEGKPPSATGDWRFMLIGLEWWLRYIRGKA